MLKVYIRQYWQRYNISADSRMTWYLHQITCIYIVAGSLIYYYITVLASNNNRKCLEIFKLFRLLSRFVKFPFPLSVDKYMFNLPNICPLPPIRPIFSTFRINLLIVLTDQRGNLNNFLLPKISDFNDREHGIGYRIIQ